MDFQFELGKTLDGTLRLFAKKNLCAEDIINRCAACREVAKETLFALYNRGYIANVDRKTYESAEKIELADRFRITVEGRDFIELHAKWWTRFWFRSIVCPVIVSFVTALNAVKILNTFKEIWRLLLSP
ncbi:MAG: hypothetical protein IKN27_08865 [Selenomonadaceae bacterium]|nr:hypothetical protein [Selenomonadaceae bacterium]